MIMINIILSVPFLRDVSMYERLVSCKFSSRQMSLLIMLNKITVFWPKSVVISYFWKSRNIHHMQ